MRFHPLLGLVAACAAIVVSGASCSGKEVLVALCASDQECIDQHDGNPHWRCEPLIGECVCTDDLACAEDEHCELFSNRGRGGDGRCHPNKSCEWNGDCDQGFCDIEDRHCRLSGCTSDVQCRLGEICDPLSTACVPGCRSHGDCNLRDVCMCTDGDGNQAPCPPCEGDDPSACPVGECVSGTCVDKTFCELREFCEQPPADSGELARCEDGYTETTPFCRPCQLSAAGECGTAGPNFCLRDTSDPSGTSAFCGVDCDDDADCPNGFSCRDVLRLTSAPCTSHDQCTPTPNAPTCSVDEDCPNGARCVGGKCAGLCAIGEGGQSGFCGCVQDSDCPTQSCGADNRCEITREVCVDDSQCRGQILCVNNGNIGYCQIGRNCAPDEGITCADVRNAHADG